MSPWRVDPGGGCLWAFIWTWTGSLDVGLGPFGQKLRDADCDRTEKRTQSRSSSTRRVKIPYKLSLDYCHVEGCWTNYLDLLCLVFQVLWKRRVCLCPHCRRRDSESSNFQRDVSGGSGQSPKLGSAQLAGSPGYLSSSSVICILQDLAERSLDLFYAEFQAFLTLLITPPSS